MVKSIGQNFALAGKLLRYEFDHALKRRRRLRSLENLPSFMKTSKMRPFLEMSQAVFSGSVTLWILRMAAFVDTTSGKVAEVIEDIRDTFPPDKTHLLTTFEGKDRPAWWASHIFVRSYVLAEWSDNQDPRSTVKGYLLHIRGKMEHFQMWAWVLKEKTSELMRRISKYRVHDSLIAWKESLVHDCELIIRFTERNFEGVSVHDLENFFERCIFYREIEASFWKMLEKNNELANIARQERSTRKRQEREKETGDTDIGERVSSGLLVLPTANEDGISVRLGKIGQRIANIFESMSWVNLSDDSLLLRRLEEMRILEDSLDRIESGTGNSETRATVQELRARIALLTDRITSASSATQDNPSTLEQETLHSEGSIELSWASLAIIARLEQVSTSIKNVSSTRQNQGVPSFGDGRMSSQVLRPLCNFAISFVQEGGIGDGPFSWSRVLSKFPSNTECFQARVIRALSGYSKNFPPTENPSIVVRQLTELLATFISHWNFRWWSGNPCSLLLAKMEKLAENHEISWDQS